MSQTTRGFHEYDRESGFWTINRVIAPPGFNRWLVPPAALAIYLCIGMAYGFSVFWLPLSQAIGGTAPQACPAGRPVLQFLIARDCDWTLSDLNWVFSLFIVFLGLASALWGNWVERTGPRLAGALAAVLWSGGLLLAAAAVQSHQLWLLWLGAGLLGGIGLGLGSIAPVSALIKWFPDRRGMAAGLGILGFGGGAMIGAPLAQALMTVFAQAERPGAWQALAVMGGIYFVFMMAGALGCRVPSRRWQPAGWVRPATGPDAMGTKGHVHFRFAHRTLAFWAIWVLLCMNVAAGIGVLSIAAPMLQEVFGSALIGRPGAPLSGPADAARVAAVAAGFVGLLSLSNIAGRFAWASLSDLIGRKPAYTVFFLIGIAMYLLAPWAAHNGHALLFIACFCVVLSLYGGAFAALPAYLADRFGMLFVGAIHGRLLTAWSTAGIIGPALFAYLREASIASGAHRASAYDLALYVSAGLLVNGLVHNLAVRTVPGKWHTPEGDVAILQGPPLDPVVGTSDTGRITPGVAFAWAAVVLPMACGLAVTLANLAALFG